MQIGFTLPMRNSRHSRPQRTHRLSYLPGSPNLAVTGDMIIRNMTPGKCNRSICVKGLQKSQNMTITAADKAKDLRLANFRGQVVNVAVPSLPSRACKVICKRCAFPRNRPSAIVLFAALQSAKHQKFCGIGAISPPTLPPGIGEFVREV
jgi:hypothetical protein